MPAVKSRNKFPSTSSITHPLPRATTSGYTRVYDGETKCLSRSSKARPFGPGNAVRISGTVRVSKSHMRRASFRGDDVFYPGSGMVEKADINCERVNFGCRMIGERLQFLVHNTRPWRDRMQALLLVGLLASTPDAQPADPPEIQRVGALEVLGNESTWTGTILEVVRLYSGQELPSRVEVFIIEIRLLFRFYDRFDLWNGDRPRIEIRDRGTRERYC